jgi:hypothetical protein
MHPSVLSNVVRQKRILDGRNALDRELWRAEGWTYRALAAPDARSRPGFAGGTTVTGTGFTGATAVTLVMLRRRVSRGCRTPTSRRCRRRRPLERPEFLLAEPRIAIGARPDLLARWAARAAVELGDIQS